MRCAGEATGKPYSLPGPPGRGASEKFIRFARLVKGPSRDLAMVESSVQIRHRAFEGPSSNGRTRLLHSRYLGSNPSGSMGQQAVGRAFCPLLSRG